MDIEKLFSEIPADVVMKVMAIIVDVFPDATCTLGRAGLAISPAIHFSTAQFKGPFVGFMGVFVGDKYPILYESRLIKPARKKDEILDRIFNLRVDLMKTLRGQ